MKVVKISPGKKAKYWNECLENEHVRVGWGSVGDLRRFDSLEELREAVKKHEYKGGRGPALATAEQLWMFRNLEPRDEVIANKGISIVVGVGAVTEPYRYDPSHHYPHVVPVDWDTSREEQSIPAQEEWMNKTVAIVDSPKLFKLITGRQLPRDANQRPQSAASRREIDILGQLDKEHHGSIRAEQSLLRKHVLGGRDHGRCIICGADLPVELLVAAHIKPRAKCSTRERRDWANIVPMCLLGCDALFERGHVAVVKGRLAIRFNESIRDSRLNAMLKFLRHREIAVEPDRRKYFEAHASLSR